MTPRASASAALFAFLVCLGAGGCADRVAGGSEIGNPGSIAGTVADSAGLGRAGVALRLLPADYDPSSAAAGTDTLVAVTDAQGRYLFGGVRAGAYVLTGRDPASGRRLLAEMTAVAKVRVEAGAAMLRPPGRVAVEAGDSEVGTPVYVPGTPIQGRVDASGLALLDSVPAGPSIKVARADGFAGTRRLDTVAVPEGGAVLAFAEAPSPGRSRTLAPGGNLQAAVDSLAAGDTLYLAGGTYWLDHLRIDRQGRPGARIAIRNRPGETPVLRGTSGSHNLVHFNGAAYVDLEGLEIDSTLPGCDAIKFEEDALSHHVALRRLHIHHVRGIAVNSQGDHHHIAVEGNHIHHTWGDPGSGIRVGGIEGAFAPSDWTLAGNWIHHCGFSEPDGSGGIHVFPGARSMVIRDNILHDNAYAGIRVFGHAAANPGGTGLSLIEGNAVWNSGEGIGAYADAVVRNNIVFACTLQFLSRQYADAAGQGKPPENVLVHHNTWHGGGVFEIRDWGADRNVVFTDNAVYATASPWIIQGTGSFAGNVGDRPQVGFAPGSAAADLAEPSGRLFHPRAGSALIGAAKGSLRVEYDFDGSARGGGNTAGAYAYPALGRALREGFKAP